MSYSLPPSLILLLGLDDPVNLLVRWYQLGVFLPVMRVHSYRLDKPHFPWLYGERAADIMRTALELRHRLVPYMYSLAHEFFASGIPYLQPLVMAFPEESVVANLTTQWMAGDIMVAPVVDNTDKWNIYCPSGTWYIFNTTTVLYGPQMLSLQVQLEDLPIYVRAGSIIALSNVIQYTDQLPGGPLHVYVYPGSNASFTLAEDDGETTAYLQGKMRNIKFQWNDVSHTLSWSANVPGPLDSRGFMTVVVHVMFPAGSKISSETTIGQSGSISF